MEKLYLTLQGTAPRRPEVSSLQITNYPDDVCLPSEYYLCFCLYLLTIIFLKIEMRSGRRGAVPYRISRKFLSLRHILFYIRPPTSDLRLGFSFLHIFRRKIYHTAKPYITHSEGMNITFCEAKNITVRRTLPSPTGYHVNFYP